MRGFSAGGFSAGVSSRGFKEGSRGVGESRAKQGWRGLSLAKALELEGHQEPLQAWTLACMPMPAALPACPSSPAHYGLPAR